ncbi:MAG: CHASE2 domain-containing protein [Armatimonadota bacterium]
MFGISRHNFFRHSLSVILAAAVASLATLCWPPERLDSPLPPRLQKLDVIRQYALALLAPLHSLEFLGYDSLYKLRGPLPSAIDGRIAIVGVDRNTEVDENINHPWPFPRRYHAQVIKNLVDDGAAVIVLDFLFSDASNPVDDRALDQALKKAGKVILACRIDRELKAEYKSLESSSEKNGRGNEFYIGRKTMEAPYYNDDLGIDLEANAQIGFAEVPQDLMGAAENSRWSDRVIRRFLPVMYFQVEWIPSLASAAYLAYNNINPEEAIRVTDRHTMLGYLRIPANGPVVIDPVDKQPIPSTYINFPAGLYCFPFYNYENVLHNDYKRGSFRGKIVFLGLTGTELTKTHHDAFITAFSHYNPEGVGGAQITELPGVVIQAQYLNSLLTGEFVTPASGWSLWLLNFFFALTGTWLSRRYMNWRGPFFLALCIFAYITLAVVSFGAWRYHIPWVIPSALILLCAGGVAWVERGRLRRKWGGYVSPAVLEHILQQEMELGASRYEASVIFGDIRNFTGFSEQHSPEKVVLLLNHHWEKLTKVIYDAQGTIDKFLGDGILAVFGAPIPLGDAAMRAVRAAWLMRDLALQPIHDDEGNPFTLSSGFGITTGPLVAGHVGSKQRHDFTVIGDTVNLASRLQGVTGKPDVIIDLPTYERVSAHVEVEPLGEVTLKGKAQPVACFRVTAWHEQGVPASRAPSDISPDEAAGTSLIKSKSE